MRRYTAERIGRVLRDEVNPGNVFHQTRPLERVADGCRAIKSLLRP